MYIFIETENRPKAGLYSSFKVFDKKELINQIKNGVPSNCLRYTELNGDSCNLISSMPLQEFENIFTKDDFTKDEITKYFKKEVSKKYGKHSLQKINKKNLKLGNLYETENGEYYIYLGKCKCIYKHQEHNIFNNNIVEKTLEGYGYIEPKSEKNIDINKLFLYNFNNKESKKYIKKPIIRKSLKKFVKDLGVYIKIPRIFNFTDDAGNSINIKFLDVKEI